MNKNYSYALTALVIIGCFIILVNINFLINNFLDFNIDLTEDKLYTFSIGTHNVLKNLKHPITIRFYRTYNENRLPVQLRSYAEDIGDILKSYKNMAKGKIILEEYDPEPESDSEASAIMDNIQPNFLPNGEKCYFGLTVSCLNRNSTIAFLSPDSKKTIEYDITRSIYEVTHPEKPKIGILSFMPVMGGIIGIIPSRFNKVPPWIFVQELQKAFDVKGMPYDTTSIEDNIAVLIVIHPVNMSKETQFAIDQYLLRGGKVIIFIDPYCMANSYNAGLNSTGSPIPPDASNLPILFSTWGIEFSEPAKVVISPENAFRPNGNPATKEHPAVLELTQKHMDKNDIIMSGLNKLNLVFTGGFTIKNSNEKTLTYSTLLHTSPYANYCESFSYYMLPEELMVDFKPLNTPIKLIVKITGFFDTAFPAAVNNANNKNLLKKSVKQGVVLLSGDANMLLNPFCVASQKINDKQVVSMINNNIDFILNAADQLSGDINIMQIRTRSTIDRKFTKLEDIYNETSKVYQDKLSLLQKKLTGTEKTIDNMQGDKNKTELATLSPKQIKALEKFKKDVKHLKNELKNIRKELRLRLEYIKARIIFINVGLIPICLTLGGITVALTRRHKHKCNLDKLTGKK
jgi:ABC-type uncharacterized transport system involved in gliding motility auxiliary subunit